MADSTANAKNHDHAVEKNGDTRSQQRLEEQGERDANQGNPGSGR